MSIVSAMERADIIVAQDGSGHFTSIQAAINSVPKGNQRNVTILVKNGIYSEKLFITNSYISIVGEDRDSTRIVFAELRKNWLKNNPNDWGSATVNIDSAVTDILFANLTIRNDYGTRFGDHDHQFAIWGKGTRIALLYCNVIGDGGDTVSLWNSSDGMYYHSNCYFEGWVDYVCPRGWCYITDSKFYGHNLTASLWHHGAGDADQKFVIRNSSFDGVEGFPLGRHHVDGQFYLIDCLFSKNMKDEPIHYPSYSPNARPWKWGTRHYFHNSHREGGDYEWFSDNLDSAAGSPTPETVSARWTFAGKWDPEDSLPAVLPFASHPFPRQNAESILTDSLLLKWIPARYGGSALIYIGKTRNVLLQKQLIGRQHLLRDLSSSTRYFWRVDQINGRDTITGPLWHFTTK
ncbi:MAG: pectin esterase [Bacteroidetes bacterium]|nr:pectin esterase [Bacteroidota bacterium]